MPRKQTRRSISISKETYDALQTKTCELGVTGSGWVESVIRPLLGLEAEEPSVRRETRSRVHSASSMPPPVSSTPPPTPKPVVPQPTPAAPIPAKLLKAEPPPPRIVKKEVAVKSDVVPPPGDKAHKIFTF